MQLTIAELEEYIAMIQAVPACPKHGLGKMEICLECEEAVSCQECQEDICPCWNSN